MFTGLIQELGVIEVREGTAEGARLRISADLAAELEPGDSVAVDGACLTVAEAGSGRFTAEVMNLTLSLTTLRDRAAEDRVNLEPPARLGDRLGGHLVQGHVDGVGRVSSVQPDGFARRLGVEVPGELSGYLVDRGSVAVNGVSLTVAGVGAGSFETSLIPETLERTNLGGLQPGDGVNIECDVIARYVERLLGRPPGAGNGRDQA